MRPRGTHTPLLLLLAVLVLLGPAGTAGPSWAVEPDETGATEAAEVGADEGAEAAEAAEAAENQPGRMVLVLDSSGSMAEPAAGGSTKIEAARSALQRVVSELPDEVEAGMRVFGATVYSRNDPGACRDSQNVVPVGELDRSALEAAVADYEPYGETPIGHALQEAAKDLGEGTAGGPRTIVLLSDGEPNCRPDPCQVARRLIDRGIELTINVVGLDVAGQARRALQCIAREGNGEYYDASSADDLVASMVKVSVRAVRGFRLDGERITGGTSSEAALPLEPGTYVDTTLPDEGRRFYLVDKPEGGAVAASAMMRPVRGEGNLTIRTELTTPDGELCASSQNFDLQILGLRPISSTAVEYNQLRRLHGAPEQLCAEADQLVLSVWSLAPDAGYRLQVSTYPAVENADELPGPVDLQEDTWTKKVQIPAGADAEPVVGGVNFDDAPELVPGTTYSDSLRPGEQLLYKVHTDYGQAARMSIRLGTDRQASRVLDLLGNAVTMQSFSSAGAALQRHPGNAAEGIHTYLRYNGDKPGVLTSAVPPVRLRNIESPHPQLTTVIHDGYQYFAIQMQGATAPEVRHFAVPTVMRVEVVGEPEGVPEYAGEVEGPGTADEQPGAEDEQSGDGGADGSGGSSPAADDSDATGTGPVLWWALGALGLLVVVGLVAVAFVAGRRSQARGGDSA